MQEVFHVTHTAYTCIHSVYITETRLVRNVNVRKRNGRCFILFPESFMTSRHGTAQHGTAWMMMSRRIRPTVKSVRARDTPKTQAETKNWRLRPCIHTYNNLAHMYIPASTWMCMYMYYRRPKRLVIFVHVHMCVCSLYIIYICT